MKEERLSNLAILLIEEEVTKNLKTESIIEEFAASDKDRRIVLL